MRTERAARRVGGFTLIEVMAAVIVLALVSTTLFRLSITGLWTEGDVERRLRASLIADATISELETALATGVPPRQGDDERVRDEYRIVTRILPLDADALGLTQALGPDSAGAEMLQGDRSGAPLLEARVRVQWQDGTAEREVTRTTFLIDPTAADGLAALAPPSEPAVTQ